jgi:hypothetical protein
MRISSGGHARVALFFVVLVVGCSGSRDRAPDPSPAPACVEDSQALPSYSVNQGLALERAWVQAGRRDAGIDSFHGAVSPELLATADEMRSELVETAALENAIPLPVDDGSPLGPGSCAAKTFAGLGNVSQAASGSSWFTFGAAYATLLEAAKMAPFDGAVGKDPYTKEEDRTASDGTVTHYKTVVNLSLSGQGSRVTAIAQFSTTITTPTGTTTESASTEASIDVCPDVGGLAIGTFKLTADGGTSGGATYHVVADQKFSIVVSDAAESIGIDFTGSMSYVSTGPSPNQLTLGGSMGYTIGSYDPAYSNALWQATDGSADNQALVADYYITFAKVMADAIEPEAKKKWRGGACVEVLIDRPSANVAPHEQVHVTATPHHKIEDVDLPEPVVATLSGPQSLSPQGQPVDGPNAAFDYVAGVEAEAGTVEFKSTSRRGIGTTSATYTVGCGAGDVFECIDGKVAGLPCKYAGTTSVTDATGRKFSANVTLTATGFEGCAVKYEPTGTVTLTPGSVDECTYSPLTVPMNATNTKGKMVISLAPNLLVADFGTHWTVDVTCGTSNPIPGQPMGGLWMFATGAPVVPGEPLAGSSSLPGISSTWNLVAQ